ncbi:acyltransferase-like protein [Mobilisporobacter senegalensis]|uniref:Acyltransferase-like protein n=1 Tax=Mobilisporobacter senegalensis TaxID=1329262 RepID=A0A3N1XIF6_9FIRM|nr:acyltransferase family protein [Mobilisporobacter senegalensis]ROR25878.1 acyltransferase-like protein [Mobilisporobacter senegalensis]
MNIALCSKSIYSKIKGWDCIKDIYIIIAMFILVWGGYYVGNFGGFSLEKNLVLYLLGYYVLSNREVLNKLEKYWILLMSLFLASLFTLVILYYNYSYYEDCLVNFVAWIGSCALIAIAMKYLNKSSKMLDYFNKASFSIYILHQSILVTVGYYVLLYVDGLFLQVVIIMVASFIMTLCLYEIIKRIPCARALIGIK